MQSKVNETIQREFYNWHAQRSALVASRNCKGKDGVCATAEPMMYAVAEACVCVWRECGEFEKGDASVVRVKIGLCDRSFR